jgi:hypothetical protein
MQIGSSLNRYQWGLGSELLKIAQIPLRSLRRQMSEDYFRPKLRNFRL